MRKYFGFLAVTGLASLPAVGMAAAPSLSDVLGSSGISAQGYVSGGYAAAFTSGSGSNTIYLHAFDTDNNSFALNQADLALSYLPASGAGALVEAMAGNDARGVNSAYGTGSADFALAQGYLQYAAGSLTVIGGRYYTLAGEEVTNDNKNTNISRSLLFTLAEPLVHTGVRASYKFSDMFTAYAGVNNTAFGSAADSDKQKTAEGSLAFTPSSAVSVSLTDYYGVDNVVASDLLSGVPQSTNVKDNFADLVGSWQATSKLQFVLNGDYVRSIGATATMPNPLALAGIAGSTAAFLGDDTLAGGAAYVNYAFNDQWKASLRGEHLYLKARADGTEASEHVSELTATVDRSIGKSFDVLAEARDDYASNFSAGGASFGPIFPGDNGSGRKSQPELELKAIYKFGTPTS